MGRDLASGHRSGDSRAECRGGVECPAIYSGACAGCGPEFRRRPPGGGRRMNAAAAPIASLTEVQAHSFSRDMVLLTKPRLSALVMLSAVVGFFFGST